MDTPDHATLRAELDRTLARLGVPHAPELALDATITPHTLLAAGATSNEPPPPSPEHTLPRLSVTFSAGTSPAQPHFPPRDLEIVSLLGEGGMGVVYRARQRALDREVAIKTVRSDVGGRAAAALESEARITGHLEHPGVVPIHVLGQAEDGRPVLVMKRIEGVSWRELLADPEHPAWARHAASDDERLEWHLDVLAQVCNAIAFAHSRGVLHRDIKPENVMVGDYGEVYVVDWGIALRADAPRGGLVGTPAYMAPEMVAGQAGPHTDVYLLGATLHEILTGAPPHRGTTLHQMLFAAICSEPPTYEPDVPPWLADLCRSAMARDPAARIPSVTVFRQRLLEHRRHRASRALSRSADERRAELAARMERADAEQAAVE